MPEAASLKRGADFEHSGVPSQRSVGAVHDNLMHALGRYASDEGVLNGCLESQH